MLRRIALCTSLTIALLAAPAGALAADVVVPSSVAGSTTVPAGGSTTLTLRCPAAAVALNGAVSGRDAAVTVRRSIPGSQAGDGGSASPSLPAPRILERGRCCAAFA